MSSFFDRYNPNNFVNRYQDLSNEEWLDVMKQSVTSPEIDNLNFPGFPPEEIQIMWVGVAGVAGVQHSFEFYKDIHSLAEKLDFPIGRQTKLLDFGCGWGRHIRYFLKDIPYCNIYGVDPNQNIIGYCMNDVKYGNFTHTPYMPKLHFDDDSFDLIYSFSVFSHLSEMAANAWFSELNRILRPGGMVVFTVRDNQFINEIEHMKRPEANITDYQQTLIDTFGDTDRLRERYENGEHIYFATHQSNEIKDIYGDAIIPPAYIEKNLSTMFSRIESLPTTVTRNQAVWGMIK